MLIRIDGENVESEEKNVVERIEDIDRMRRMNQNELKMLIKIGGGCCVRREEYFRINREY
jgi:hypothetical protein